MKTKFRQKSRFLPRENGEHFPLRKLDKAPTTSGAFPLLSSPLPDGLAGWLPRVEERARHMRVACSKRQQMKSRNFRNSVRVRVRSAAPVKDRLKQMEEGRGILQSRTTGRGRDHGSMGGAATTSPSQSFSSL